MDLSSLPEWLRLTLGFGLIGILLAFFTWATVTNAKTERPDNCKTVDSGCCGSTGACSWDSKLNTVSKGK